MKLTITKCPKCDGPMVYGDAVCGACWAYELKSVNEDPYELDEMRNVLIEGEERAASSIAQDIEIIIKAIDKNLIEPDDERCLDPHIAMQCIAANARREELLTLLERVRSGAWRSFAPRGPESPREIEVE